MRDASGQTYMRNRYYNAQTGQFTQTDPIGLAGGLNSYGFAAGDPISFSDPYGLSPCSELRDQIDQIAVGIEGRISRYEAHYANGDADTGHRTAIDEQKNRYDRQMRRYNQMKCNKEDDHDDWPGSGLGANLATRIAGLPAPQVDQSHGWGGPRNNTINDFANPVRLSAVTVRAPKPEEAALLLTIGAIILVVMLLPVGL